MQNMLGLILSAHLGALPAPLADFLAAGALIYSSHLVVACLHKSALQRVEEPAPFHGHATPANAVPSLKPQKSGKLVKRLLLVFEVNPF